MIIPYHQRSNVCFKDQPFLLDSPLTRCELSHLFCLNEASADECINGLVGPGTPGFIDPLRSLFREFANISTYNEYIQNALFDYCFEYPRASSLRTCVSLKCRCIILPAEDAPTFQSSRSPGWNNRSQSWRMVYVPSSIHSV